MNKGESSTFEWWVRARAVDPPVSLRSRKANAGPVFALFGGAIGFSLLVVLVDSRTPSRLFWLLMALLMAALLLFFWQWHIAVREGVVRVDRDHPTLRFRPRRSLAAVEFVAPAVLVVFGIANVVAVVTLGEALGETRRARGIHWLALPALGYLVYLLWARRVRPGLTLSVEGIAGVRRSKRVDSAWDDIASVTVRRRGYGAMLEITFVDGGRRMVEPERIGSDPNVVAAVIEHYLLSPEDRHVLVNPVAALKRVDAKAASPES